MAVEERDWSLELGLTTYWLVPLKSLFQPLRLEVGGNSTAAFQYLQGIDSRTLNQNQEAHPPMCLAFCFVWEFFEMRSYCVAQANLNLPTGPPNQPGSSLIHSSLDYFNTSCDVNS